MFSLVPPLFFVLTRRPTGATLFPYTTLFRSVRATLARKIALYDRAIWMNSACVVARPLNQKFACTGSGNVPVGLARAIAIAEWRYARAATFTARAPDSRTVSEASALGLSDSVQMEAEAYASDRLPRGTPCTTR